MEIRNLFHKAGSKWPTYGIQIKDKKQILRNSREKTREEYTLDWSQSKVLLVVIMNKSQLVRTPLLSTWMHTSLHTVSHRLTAILATFKINIRSVSSIQSA